MRSDVVPADLTRSVDHEVGRARDMEGIKTDPVVYAVQANHNPIPVPEHRKRDWVFGQVPGDRGGRLGGDNQELNAPLCQVPVDLLQLNQLPSAVPSPGSPHEDQKRRKVVGEPKLLVLGIGQDEVRGRAPNGKCVAWSGQLSPPWKGWGC